MPNSIDKWLSEKLEERKEKNILRSLPPQNNRIDFTSNDYLGLARSEELFLKIQQKIESLPVANGSTGSRLLSGNSLYAEQVESKLAGIFKSKSALLFNSGYAANLAVLSSIPQRGDSIIYDQLVHACMKDGARLSQATRYSFRHNDMHDLEMKLKISKGKIFIAVESFYSMEGDECPLREIINLAEKYDASVILDEAHSTGVVGALGSGFSVVKNLHEKIAIRIYTFGKAMGIHGACVAGSQTLIDYLINFSRPFIFTTALSNHGLASIECAFDYLATHIRLQQTLQDKIALYLAQIRNLQNRMASLCAIQTIVCPGNAVVKQMADSLQQNGFDVRPIVYPTVPKESERLRICLHTFNGDDEITSLTKALLILA